MIGSRNVVDDGVICGLNRNDVSREVNFSFFVLNIFWKI